MSMIDAILRLFRSEQHRRFSDALEISDEEHLRSDWQTVSDDLLRGLHQYYEQLPAEIGRRLEDEDTVRDDPQRR